MSKRVVDVFVTRDDYGFDDKFVMTITGCSEPSSGNAGADLSDSVWFRNLTTTTAEFQEGDVVRVGLPAFASATDYVTIMEKVPITIPLVGYAYRMDHHLKPLTGDLTETVVHKGETYTKLPAFRSSEWPLSTMQCRLDSGMKNVHWVKLVGYSMFNKRSSNLQSHEMIVDDWVAMHVDEIPGDVVSNNAFANASFAVLHAGDHVHKATGATQYHTYDPQGIASHTFEQPTTLRNLNFKFLDRKGEVAHMGRLHMWFKMCVTYC